MTREIDKQPVRRRKLSVKEYASKVFQESSVSAVSAIVTTGNIWKKIFRVFVFLAFTFGFLYQCIEFLHHYWQFPTVVNIDMESPDKYLAPAYTFCNFNPIVRSKFCSKYPESCYEPDKEFCQMYPNFCEENNTQVPKDDVVFKYLNSPEQIMELVHDSSALMGHLRDLLEEKPEGPLLRTDKYGYKAAACYSLYGRIDSPLEPSYRNRSEWHDRPWDYMFFDPREKDILYPDSKPGILLSIHSPFEAVNPFENGIFLKPGRVYHISVEMVEEELLKHPYKTDCLNYTEMWLSANKTGPRSQKMCRHRCILEYTENCFNCSFQFSLYPSRIKNFCQFDGAPPNSTIEICDDWKQYTAPCVNKCKKECTGMKYYYQVQESYAKGIEKSNNNSHLENKIIVLVNFEEAEIMKIKYKPQYESVEEFSFIGGFIGIWLGISLVEVADVLESLFLILMYFLKKGSIVCFKKRDSEIGIDTL